MAFRAHLCRQPAADELPNHPHWRAMGFISAHDNRARTRCTQIASFCASWSALPSRNDMCQIGGSVRIVLG